MNPNPTINIPLTHGNCPVHIKVGALAELIGHMESVQKLFIITHPRLERLYGQYLNDQLKSINHKIILMPEGEPNKTVDTVSEILTELVAAKAERKDAIMAFGGGIIGDVAGFCASVYLRGIQFFQAPTSLLAMVDSSVGGKTGVNLPTGKNLVGTFYQPVAIGIDPTFLATLSPREFRCGLAEIIKYGIISDSDLLDTIITDSRLLNPSTLSVSQWIPYIHRSVTIKAQYVSADETEQGIREVLNFGHTIGHAIEATGLYNIYTHGEAVALGMVAETQLAVNMGLITHPEFKRVLSVIQQFGFDDVPDPAISRSGIMHTMMTDKKIRNGQIRMVLPIRIGETQTVTVTREQVEEVLDKWTN